MGRVEFVADNIATVELCGHFMCSCRNGLGDRMPELLTLEDTVITQDSMTTPIRFTTPDGSENVVNVNGVVNRRDLEEAFEAETGPVIMGDGQIVCGAIDILIRKRNNGR